MCVCVCVCVCAREGWGCLANVMCNAHVQGWPEPNRIYALCMTVYDRIFGDFHASNTVYTPCIYGYGQPFTCTYAHPCLPAHPSSSTMSNCAAERHSMCSAPLFAQSMSVLLGRTTRHLCPPPLERVHRTNHLKRQDGVGQTVCVVPARHREDEVCKHSLRRAAHNLGNATTGTCFLLACSAGPPGSRHR